MTPDELDALVALVVANDGRTIGRSDVAVWAAALGDLPYDDCRAAVLGHVRVGEGWLTPSMVRRAVRALRLDRLDRAPDTPPPGVDPDDVPAYLAAVKAQRRAIASGELVPQQPQIDPAGARRVQQAIASTFRRVPTTTEEST